MNHINPVHKMDFGGYTYKSKGGCRENLDSLYFSLKYPFSCNKRKTKKDGVFLMFHTTQPNLFCLINSSKRIITSKNKLINT